MSHFQRIIAPLALFALSQTGAAVLAEDSLSVNSLILQRETDLSRHIPEIDASASQQEILPVQPFQSLTSEITRVTTGRRATALRMAEDGRTFLQNQRPEKALARFETSMALEASPYTYYYLALAHARLGHYRQSLSFLDVAENWLSRDPAWLAEISSLRDHNRHALKASLRNDLAKIRYDPWAQVERAGRPANRSSEPEPPFFPFGLAILLLFFFLWIAWSWNRPPTSRARPGLFSASQRMGRPLGTPRKMRNLWANKWSV